MPDDVQEAIAHERRLLSPDVRRSPAQLEDYLDPAFHEVGASGRHLSRSEIIELLTAEETRPAAEISEMTGTAVAEGVVLLTYFSHRDGRCARRCSLWRRSPDGWRVLYHQGTPASRA